MNNISHQNLTCNISVYRVPTPYAPIYLPLVVDGRGMRYLPLTSIAEVLGASMAREILPMTDTKYWERQTIMGRSCIPVERVGVLFGKIKGHWCKTERKQFLGWCQTHGQKALADFHIPDPIEPMLTEEPERTVGLVPQMPSPAPAETGLRTFNFGAAPFRVLVRDGNPWWFASEICSFLDLGNTRQAVTRLDEDERDVISNDVHLDSTFTPGIGAQSFNIVNEPGLYSLVLGSRKPEAKAFKRWITHEVIPAIRKTGTYGVAQRDPMAVLNDPAAMRGILLTYTEKVLTLECKVQEQGATIADLEPKAAGLDRIAAMTKDSARTITDAAKILDWAPKKFFTRLQAEKWIYRQNARWMAYQDKIQQGLMEHKYCNVQHDHGTEFDVAQPLITTKGIAKLAAMLGVPAAA